MSIKEQVDFAKEELSQDEKLLAGLIKAERFYRRNKVLIIAVAALLVVGGIGYQAMEYMKQQRLLAANEAYLRLTADPSDREALKRLQEKNPALAALFELDRAVAAGDVKGLKALEKNSDPVVSALAAYHVAALEKSAQDLKNYRMKSGALVKDFALFDEAYLLLKAGKSAEARERLNRIAEGSPLSPAARMLAHYGVSAKGGE